MLFIYRTIRQVRIIPCFKPNFKSLHIKIKNIFPISSFQPFSTTLVQTKKILIDSNMENATVDSIISSANEVKSQNIDHILTSSSADSVVKSDTAEVEGSNKAIPSQEPGKPVSKRALKRQSRAQQYRELKKRRKAENLLQTGRDEAGFNLEEFDQTSYYFENGLRKVYPYPFVFATYAKGRWVGRTLKNVLEKEFGFDYPEDVDKAFHQGKIHVNGTLAGIDYVVKDCDYISHQIHRHENPVTETSLQILADTDEVVVINKPSSIPCHPCGRYRYNSVVFILGKEMGYSNLRNIYRLDRLTSGVLMMGKTAAATKKLEDQVLKREVQKEYVCRVVGEFPSETVTVDQPLTALSNKLRLQVVSPSGKSSQTTFTRLSYNGRTSAVRCVPHTGRTHQIRVHLQYLGHPIINDVFYNSDAWGPNKGKGGNYEIPFDKVCNLIMRKHQATQWEGGENPKFHQKLKEMEEVKQSGKVSNRELSVTSEPELIKLNSDPAETETSMSNVNNSCDQVVKESIHSRDKNAPVQCVNSNTDNESTKLPSTEAVSSSKCNCDNEENNETGLAVTSELPVAQPGFDWTKWQVDASCDLCRKLTLDPKPRDLVMFLHAWKYKGPGWEYATELPDWAQDDWNQEEDFILESTTDHQTSL